MSVRITERWACWKTVKTATCKYQRAGWWLNTKQSGLIVMTQALGPERMELISMQDV